MLNRPTMTDSFDQFVASQSKQENVIVQEEEIEAYVPQFRSQTKTLAKLLAYHVTGVDPEKASHFAGNGDFESALGSDDSQSNLDFQSAIDAEDLPSSADIEDLSSSSENLNRARSFDTEDVEDAADIKDIPSSAPSADVEKVHIGVFKCALVDKMPSNDEETGFGGTSSGSSFSPRNNDGYQQSSTDYNDSEATLSSKEKKKKRVCRAICFLIIGLIPGICVFVFLAIREFNRSEESSTTETAPPPTALVITEQHVMNLLPNYTMDSLQDPESPQSKAFQWILDDTSHANYPDSRILQRFGLATFYHATGGDSWLDNTNWLNHSVHECQWFSGSVSQYACNSFPSSDVFRNLWLVDNGLEGTLPPELYLLSSLESITLARNNLLTGTISTSIGQLSSLKGLALGVTGIDGTIPSEIGSLQNISTLMLLSSRLRGALPSELGMLLNLELLYLNWNVSICFVL
jgi:hypothetical protein